MKLFISLMLLALCAWLPAVWDTTEVRAQSRQEPRIEGVSLSEIVQWQTRYGGGPVYGPHPGFPGYAPDCVQPYPVLYEPVKHNVKKLRKGKKSRKQH
ncbi:MAG: hypothetical protein RDU20_05670 [Desulfomonilaceae bacterium]|nr:hypothetical protein [Desulfomonilaceae bacterium]